MTQDQETATAIEPLIKSKRGAAKHLGCDAKTLDRWVRAGAIKEVPGFPGWFKTAELERFADEGATDEQAELYSRICAMDAGRDPDKPRKTRRRRLGN